MFVFSQFWGPQNPIETKHSFSKRCALYSTNKLPSKDIARDSQVLQTQMLWTFVTFVVFASLSLVNGQAATCSGKPTYVPSDDVTPVAAVCLFLQSLLVT